VKASLPVVREGSILVDEKGRRTGKVLELIGPVSSPYLSVQPFTDRIERIAGSKLYLGEEEPRDLGRKRNFDRERTSPRSPRRGESHRSPSRPERFSKRS
jgi:rRNA processing protein Gar1